MSGRAAGRDSGWALIEALVSMAVLASAFVVLVQLASTGQRLARAQPAAADMRQPCAWRPT